METSLYYIIGIITFALSWVVRTWLQSTYRKWGQVQNHSGLTGAEAARTILNANGLHHVRLEGVRGQLTDHYDPQAKTIRLSQNVFDVASVASMAVAAHEVGHALQDATSYGPLRIRSGLSPLATLGARFGPMAAILGATMDLPLLAQLGVLFFIGAILFQLVTLPVEFNASRRAIRQIDSLGLATDSEERGARKVLNAAAMTYVAGVASSTGYLIYLLLAGGKRTVGRRPIPRLR